MCKLENRNISSFTTHLENCHQSWSNWNSYGWNRYRSLQVIQVKLPQCKSCDHESSIDHESNRLPSINARRGKALAAAAVLGANYSLVRTRLHQSHTHASSRHSTTLLDNTNTHSATKAPLLTSTIIHLYTFPAPHLYYHTLVHSPTQCQWPPLHIACSKNSSKTSENIKISKNNTCKFD